jgi:hypothetical protein
MEMINFSRDGTSLLYQVTIPTPHEGGLVQWPGRAFESLEGILLKEIRVTDTETRMTIEFVSLEAKANYPWVK